MSFSKPHLLRLITSIDHLALAYLSELLFLERETHRILSSKYIKKKAGQILYELEKPALQIDELRGY
jgi:hypothetical protein